MKEKPIRCQYCPAIIWRTVIAKKATCFDCKMKRIRAQTNARPKKQAVKVDPKTALEGWGWGHLEVERRKMADKERNQRNSMLRRIRVLKQRSWSPQQLKEHKDKLLWWRLHTIFTKKEWVTYGGLPESLKKQLEGSYGEEDELLVYPDHPRFT